MSFVKAQFVLPAGAAQAPRSLGDFRKANFMKMAGIALLAV